jgi:hypothetical protein
MTRNRFFAALAGIVGLGAAKGQTASPLNRCTGVDMVSGKTKDIKCPESPIVPVDRLGWPDGKATNNQCPVCGTMAKQLIAQRWPTQDGYRSIMNGAAVERINPREELIPAQSITRCGRCNCAFWQDAV